MPISEAQRLRIQNQVTAILAEAPDLDMAAPLALEAIGTGSEWAWGSLWMLDEVEGNLRIQVAWSAPDFHDSEFRAESERLRFAPGQGLPGITWTQGGPQWMDDLAQDSRFVRRQVAAKAGLKSGFAFPVRLQERVLGVMAFFSRRYRASDEDFLEMMAALGSQMGQFIERKRVEATLKRNEERYRAVVEQSGEGILLFNMENGAILECNPALCRLLGYTPNEMGRMSIFDIIAHEQESIVANIQSVQERGHLQVGERQFRRKDGTSADVHVSVSRVTFSGERIAVALVQDISLQKGMKAERDRLAEILEVTTDLVGISDPEGHALYGNRAMRELRGPDYPELRRPIGEAHPAWAARKVLEEGLPTAMKDGLWRGETAFLDREGHEIPTSQLILAHRDSEGNLAFLSTIARDISEQKKTEQKLKAIVERLEDLRYTVDESTIFAITDDRGVITEVNEHFCKVSGYTREELLGKTHRIINSGFHPKAFFKEMWDTIRVGRNWRGEIRNRAKDGTDYWVDTTIVPRMNAEGQPERFMSLRTVITERKQAEEALMRRERQMELLSAASRELNQELDLPVVMRRLVETGLNLTGAMAGTYGLIEEDRIRVREYLRGGSWAPVELVFEKGQGVPGLLIETRQPHLGSDAEWDPWVLADVQKRLGFQNYAAIPILGRKGGLLGFFGIHDKAAGAFDLEDQTLLEGLAAHAAVAMENARLIEDQRREEEALRHTQKLESLGLLAGGIAHDFNNLLAAILGNLNLVMLETPTTTPHGLRLQNIERAVMRAADLTRQMLAYAGKGQFQVRRIDLNATVVEIAQLLEASLSKKISLKFVLGKDLPPLEADPAQLEQVILNLVTNAADAIGDREGRIRIVTGFRNLNEANLHSLFPGQTLRPGLYVTLDVTDDGSGIPPEILDRIFDPFFTTKSKGRGLGLSAMLGILMGHGGGIKIYSEPGQGSTFRVFLPGTPHASANRQEPAEASDWRGYGTVLVVDDDDEVRSSTCAQMANLGLQTLEARDGLEGVEIYCAQADFIDLVFMDISMPHMDGREALHAIRAVNSHARVILCSGFDEGAIRPTLGHVEPTAFLQKPFHMEELRRVLRDALEGGAKN